MRDGRPISALAAIAVLLSASLASLLLPACSRKHNPAGLSNNQRPTVAITASATSGPSPLTVLFTAVADDEDGAIASYMWMFSDSGHLHGDTSQVRHTFAAQGDYIVTVRATDDLGAYAEARDTIRVGGADRAPVVNAGSDQLNRNPGTTVNLSGSVTEPDGQSFSVLWTQIGGPTVAIANPTSTSGASFVSVGSTSAAYSFRLTATDVGTPPNSGSDNVTVTTRNTWNNGVRTVFAARCTTCHYASNPSGIPSWQGHTETASYSSSIRSRISVGGNMRSYLSTTPIHEPNMLIRWIDDGAPLQN